MNKNDYIAYWKNIAAKDWKRANLLYKNRDYVFALFCVHLTLEKLLKAHWVKDNKENIAPKIHNLVLLADKTNITLTDDKRAFLEKMNAYQLEGRYPDYQQQIYKMTNSKMTSSVISQANQIRLWLLKNL